MKQIAAVPILICGIALALPAPAPAHSQIYAVKVTIKLRFKAPQRITGKVSSPLPACRSNRTVEIQALDGSGKTELVSDGGGAFHGRPANGISPHTPYRVGIAKKTVRGSGAHQHVCEGVAVTLNS
jgi:hypothetical protein